LLIRKKDLPNDDTSNENTTQSDDLPSSSMKTSLDDNESQSDVKKVKKFKEKPEKSKKFLK
jgi:hypothetical protein